MSRAIAGLLAVLLPVFALAAVTRDGDATVVFSGKGPAGFRLEGKTAELNVGETDAAYAFSVPLGTLKTGIELRDRHMKEKYLEVDKYPNAELKVPKGGVTLPEDGKTTSGTVDGELAIHGHTRKVPVRYTLKRVGAKYELQAGLTTDIRQHGISIPSYLGVTVKPLIEVAVTGSFKR